MKQNKNKKIFIIAFFLFLATVLFLLYDMARHTTAPWNKTKSIERITNDSLSIPDTILLPDSLLQ